MKYICTEFYLTVLNGLVTVSKGNDKVTLVFVLDNFLLMLLTKPPQALLHQYEQVLNTCNVEVFLKLGTLYGEMASHERNIDFYVDLLRKDQVG